MKDAVSNIKKRYPDRTEEEILNLLNNWDVTPTKDGRIGINMDGDFLFRVNDYENNLGAFFALTSEKGLGSASGGMYSLSKIVQTKAPGNYVMDFGDDFVSLQVQGALVAEGMGRIKVNTKLEEAKNLNKNWTGRVQSKNLNESLAMKQVMSNPLEGAKEATKLKMTDPRQPASEGWVKMESVVEYNGGKTTIHFNYNKVTGKFDDFKFKD